MRPHHKGASCPDRCVLRQNCLVVEESKVDGLRLIDRVFIIFRLKGSAIIFFRPAACNWDDFSKSTPNPQVLYGALVGGPFVDGFYRDIR